MPDDVVSAPTPTEPVVTPASDAAPVAPTPADSAPSQGADQGDTRESLLEAVQQAVQPRSSQPGDDFAGERRASPAQSTAPGYAEEDDPSLPDDYTDEDLAKFSQGFRARIKRVLKQRNEARSEADRLRTFEPGARAADSVQQYLRQHDIGRDDFVHGLNMMGALRRGDFRTFYEGIEPYFRLAQEYLGVQLPPDLQQAVQQGQMTTEVARGYARTRMDAQMHRNQVERSQRQVEEQRQAFVAQQAHSARERLANEVAAKVNSWESVVAARDPAYGQKQAAVRSEMWAVVREVGAPQTPDQAVQIARESYRRVNDRYQSWSQPRRPTLRTPSSTGRTVGAAPEPKSLADAVRIARESARI